MKFFRCEKCTVQFVTSEEVVVEQMICGAVTNYIFADDPDVGNDGIIKSIGIKPLGCGGKIKEITLEEAMTYE